MDRTTIQVGGFAVNCSILSENGKAWIIDPGQEGDRIVKLLRESDLSPQAILLTHAHFDHIGAIPVLQAAYPDLLVYVHDNDLKVINHPLNQLPPEYSPIGQPKNPASPESLDNLESLEVLETPGHTPGGVCYYLKNAKLLFSGDTLFAGSVGRTDLPGGNMAMLTASLQKLTALPDDTIVIPGHGMFTTIGDEKRGNPFLQ